jgi:hypothetical protein
MTSEDRSGRLASSGGLPRRSTRGTAPVPAAAPRRTGGRRRAGGTRGPAAISGAFQTSVVGLVASPQGRRARCRRRASACRPRSSSQPLVHLGYRGPQGQAPLDLSERPVGAARRCWCRRAERRPRRRHHLDRTVRPVALDAEALATVGSVGAESGRCRRRRPPVAVDGVDDLPSLRQAARGRRAARRSTGRAAACGGKVLAA